MEKINYKEFFYVFGVLVTFLISLASLIITVKNRRNGIREHLYKEQLNCIYKIMPLLPAIYNLAYDIALNLKSISFFEKQKINTYDLEKEFEKSLALLESKQDELDSLIDTYGNLFNLNFYSKLSNVSMCASKLSIRASLRATPITTQSKALKDYRTAWNILDDEVTTHIGGETLSIENRNLIRKERLSSVEEMEKFYSELELSSGKKDSSFLKDILKDVSDEKIKSN